MTTRALRRVLCPRAVSARRAAAEGGVVGKLPAWIAQSVVTARAPARMHDLCGAECQMPSLFPSLQVNGSFGEAHGRLHRFFRERAAAAEAEAAAAAAAAEQG